jgi:hypothetical protein
MENYLHETSLEQYHLLLVAGSAGGGGGQI